jgi:hypothetical protein
VLKLLCFWGFCFCCSFSPALYYLPPTSPKKLLSCSSKKFEAGWSKSNLYRFRFRVIICIKQTAWLTIVWLTVFFKFVRINTLQKKSNNNIKCVC